LLGGEINVETVGAYASGLASEFPFVASDESLRMFRAYGTQTGVVIGDAKLAADLGRRGKRFGGPDQSAPDGDRPGAFDRQSHS
jgi:hypothetical protein